MKLRKILALCLALILCMGLMVPASAVSASDALSKTASNLQKQSLAYGSIGGEWAALGLVRGGYSVSEAY